MRRKDRNGLAIVHVEISEALKTKVDVHIAQQKQTLAAFVEAAITEKLDRAEAQEEKE